MNKARKTSHILNVFQYNETTGAVTLPGDLALTTPASSDNSTKASTTAWVRTYVTGLSYLTTSSASFTYVPYTGASGSLNLGAYELSASLVNASTFQLNSNYKLEFSAYGFVTLTNNTKTWQFGIGGDLELPGDVIGGSYGGNKVSLASGAHLKSLRDGYVELNVGLSGTETARLTFTNNGSLGVGTTPNYGTSGQFLTSGGSSGAVTWTTVDLSSYATQSYVGTQLANLVASAPSTLNTLNELAAALGNDPSFATTVSTSIGTKVPQARTLTINGTAYDLSADRAWTITSMIYPGAGIAVSTGTAWGTSITNNSTNWNTAYGWGNHASAGYLTGITSSNVTTALGYTPLSASGDVTIGGYLTVNGAGTSSSIYMKDSDEGNREIHCNSNRIGFLTQAGAWGAWCDDSGNWNAANFSGSSSGTNTGDQNLAPYLLKSGGTMSGTLTLASISGTDQMVENTYGAYLHLGDWAVGRTAAGAVLVNTAYRADYATDLFDMNISRFTNNSGYVTSSHQHDTLYYSGSARLWTGSDGTRNSGWAYHQDNGTGLHWPNNGWHLYPENANDFWWRSGNSTESTIHFSKAGNAGSYIHNASDHAIGFLTTGRGWSLRVDNAGGATVYGGLTVRNAIYLDANEDLYLNYNYGCSIVGVYASTRYQGIFSMGNSWKLARDGSTPGNLYGLAWSHPNAGGQAGYLSTHGLLVMENGTCNTALANGIWTRGDVTAYSDARVKDNVEVIENAVEKVKAIRGVTFTRNDRKDKTTRFAGVIAQEVLKVLPEVVTEDAIGTYSVAYGNLNALLIEAIKEQQKEIDELKSLINGLTK